MSSLSQSHKPSPRFQQSEEQKPLVNPFLFRTPSSALFLLNLLLFKLCFSLSLLFKFWLGFYAIFSPSTNHHQHLQKSENLAADILSWFSQPKVALSIDDLEHLLDEHMMLSFNTDTEDGSIEELAEELMTMHEDCLYGHYESIEKLRKSTFKAKSLSQLRQGELVNEDEMKVMSEL